MSVDNKVTTDLSFPRALFLTNNLDERVFTCRLIPIRPANLLYLAQSA